MPERQKGNGPAPAWAGRGVAPGGRSTGTPRKKGRAPTQASAVRSLAGESERSSSAGDLLDELSDTIAGYMERLIKIESTHIAQIVAEMDVNPFGFSVLARWRDLIVAHATKTYWQQVYDMAHEVRDPISALSRVIEDAADGIVQNRVGPPENVFNEAMSIAIDTGRRDFLLEAKVLRDHYRSRGT